MSKTIDPSAMQRLADHFASILHTNLPRHTITACADAQKLVPEGVCALHDVCDPNEYMLQALAKTFPEECKADGSYDFDPQDHDLGRLIDAAWPLGRHILFASAEIQRLQGIIENAQAATRFMHVKVVRALNGGCTVEQLRPLLTTELGQLRDDLNNANVPETSALQRSKYPPRDEEPIDWSKPLFDSSGYEHSLVHLGAREVVTKQTASYCVWDRRSGACRISECEGLTLSNTPLTDEERSAIYKKGEALYEQMRAAATPRG